MAQRKRILIVEDEEKWREDILREALEGEGYHVQTSSSFEQAVAILDWTAFDLVVVDVNLTGVSGNQDGIRIVERLATEGDQTPLIVVSASKTRDAARERLKEFGPVAFVDKTTFDIAEFVGVVAGVLENKMSSEVS
jgi:DNA-binding NtrC family response regulator